MKPEIKASFDEATNTVSYVVHDPETSCAAIIDSVLDYDANSGRTTTASADDVIDYIKSNQLKTQWILETHAHADHLSAAPYLKEKLGGRIGIGEHIKTVQQVFLPVFNMEQASIEADSARFDYLFKDGEMFTIGNLAAEVIHTPGHTPACITYHIGDAAFVGDTLFMPDFGTARVDFPGGDAETLYNSIQKIFALPDDTRLFMCHDYKAKGRDVYAWETTVKEERENNVHVGHGNTKEDFIEMRTARDKTLNMPKLILPSIQVNIRAGQLPEPSDNGVRYLKIPLNAV